MRAYQRFDERNGGFFAAGLTYYTIFALFPLLMVGFAVVGFVLSRRPQLLSTIDDHIRSPVTGALGQQMLELMNSAIDARTSVGVIGLATAAWAGLGWMIAPAPSADGDVVGPTRSSRRASSATSSPICWR